jgi:ParB family chromosome partitioning protein
VSAKRGLGRGLGALIPETPSGSAEPGDAEGGRPGQATTDGTSPAAAHEAPDGATVRYAELPLDSIVPNARQPRQVFDDDALTELAFSIGEIGLLQPVVVRPVGDGRFELVAGERRLRACRLAGLTAVPAIVRQTDDDDLLRDALLENLHRADLNALEEAAAYQQLLADFGCTQEELARRIGRSRPQVTNTLRLLRLPPDVQRRVAAGVLSAGHARALLSLDDPAAMETLASRIVAEGLSVRAVEEIVMVGEAEGRRRPTRTRRPRSQTVEDVVSQHVSRAAEALDTRVAARGFARTDARGRLVIECADLADLARIVALISD